MSSTCYGDLPWHTPVRCRPSLYERSRERQNTSRPDFHDGKVAEMKEYFDTELARHVLLAAR